VGAVPYVLPGVEGTAFGSAMLVVSIIGMALVLTYKGFVYAASKAIPFWNIQLLPFLYIAYALRGGAALLLVAGAIAGDVFDVDLLEVIKLWVVVSSAVLVLLYLVLASNASAAARRSVRQLVAGRLSPGFYAVVVFLGLVIPIALGAVGEATSLSRGLLAFIGVSSLAGDLYIKYCVVKAGIYIPILSDLPATRVYGRHRAEEL
jgi:formate-dependent nitrite reductase membrane component NrfD